MKECSLCSEERSEGFHTGGDSSAGLQRMNTGLPDGGKRVYKSNGAFRGSSGKLDPRDVWEKPGTRP